MSRFGESGQRKEQAVTDREPITACLIVKNEEERLPAALASLGWCDHIVVVDSESEDRTVELAKAAGATVIEQPWLGFGPQRNVALDHAPTDWVLEVDADERVTPQLRASIEQFLAAPKDVAICAMPLRDRLLGRALGPSAKYPRYRHRMFRRSVYRHEARLVHEGVKPQGPVWALDGDLDHELASTWREAITDVWNYARLESAQIPPRSAIGYASQLGLRPFAKLLYRLIIDGGWRDGWQGFVRIGLDVVSDVLTYTRQLIGRVPPNSNRSDNCGRDMARQGPARIVVIGGGKEATPFLSEARRAGADLALIAVGEVSPPDGVPVHCLPRPGPLSIARALDALQQIRAIDQLVLGSVWTPLWLVPKKARGVVPPVPLRGTDPTELVHRLTSLAT